MQKVDLVDTMLLIGMTTYFAATVICIAAVWIKSELYHGQSLHWQWASVCGVEKRLSTIHVPSSADALDWMNWEHCQDDMSLLDGTKAMIPSLFR